MGGVWFSRRATWEPTATKRFGPGSEGRHATIEEMVHAGGALARIEVLDDVARHSWTTHRQIGGVDPRIADGLELAAREQGADPDEWRVSYHDVPLAECLSIEASTDGHFWDLVGVPGDYGVFSLHPAFVEKVREALGRRSEKGGD